LCQGSEMPNNSSATRVAALQTQVAHSFRAVSLLPSLEIGGRRATKAEGAEQMTPKIPLIIVTVGAALAFAVPAGAQAAR
jgi:hypothetical protein